MCARYVRVSNAGPVAYTGDDYVVSWNLYELQVYAYNGDLVSVFVDSASSEDDGTTQSTNAIDGSTSTYWTSDPLLGDLAANSWSTSKIGVQWIILDLGGEEHVDRVDVLQGPTGDVYAVQSVQLEFSEDKATWCGPFIRAVTTGRTTLLGPWDTAMARQYIRCPRQRRQRCRRAPL